jgi:hypothetical protein
MAELYDELKAKFHNTSPEDRLLYLSQEFPKRLETLQHAIASLQTADAAQLQQILDDEGFLVGQLNSIPHHLRELMVTYFDEFWESSLAYPMETLSGFRHDVINSLNLAAAIAALLRDEAMKTPHVFPDEYGRWAQHAHLSAKDMVSLVSALAYM